MKTCLIFAIFGASLWAQFTPLATPPKSDSNPEIAVVDGHSVTLNDIRQMLDTAPPQVLSTFKQNPQMAIQIYYLIKHLSAEGDKAKLAEESPLKEQLEMVRAGAIAQAMINHERDGYKVTEDMVKSFYEQNKSRYEAAKVKIIYIAFKPGVADQAPCTKTMQECAQEAVEREHAKNGRSEGDAKKLAEDILAQLKAGGKFEDMVEKYSDDAETKKAGGDLGKPVTSTSAYSDEVKKAIFALKVGEVSSPFLQSPGFLLIRLEEKTAQPMDGQVTEAIIQEIRSNHLQDYMNGLNKRFQPAIKDPGFFVKPDDYLSKPAK
jgi:hypothetical protein